MKRNARVSQGSAADISLVSLGCCKARLCLGERESKHALAPISRSPFALFTLWLPFNQNSSSPAPAPARSTSVRRRRIINARRLIAERDAACLLAPVLASTLEIAATASQQASASKVRLDHSQPGASSRDKRRSVLTSSVLCLNIARSLWLAFPNETSPSPTASHTHTHTFGTAACPKSESSDLSSRSPRARLSMVVDSKA